MPVNEIRESLADIQHEIWAHWMNYQFSKCIENEDGSLTIPANLVVRWRGQADTFYDQLTELEKDSDREQADKILDVLSDALSGYSPTPASE